MVHNLLDEPLLSWRDHDRRRSKTTLPGLLTKLGSGELADFPRLRAHQFHPWGMFLTQLATLALHRAGKADPQISEGSWKDGLLVLTGGAVEPWCLIVDDLSKPAFFQPPAAERSIESWSTAEHPDDLDVLVTAKAHDVKTGLLAADDTEAWIYALVTLQTMQGFPGRGYTRISRMKGGYGSRPRIGVANDHRVAPRFTRDVAVMLGGWLQQLALGYRDRGTSLAWIDEWDGSTSLGRAMLSPHFIEICWRVRLQMDPRGLRASYTTTKNRRCLPEVENGDVGDPWIPIEGEGGALTISARGFDYQQLTRIIFPGDFTPAAAQVITDEDGDPVTLHLAAMARGQGKTQGLHERALVIRGRAKRSFTNADQRAAVGKRAVSNVQQADKMRTKVLYPALRQLALGDTVVDDEFHARVDEIFFERLFADLEKTDDEARLAWDAAMRAIAWRELQLAVDRCCVPDARRFKAITESEGTFRGCLAKQFPDLVATERKAKEEAARA